MTGGQTEQVLPCLQPMGLTAGPLPSSSAEEDRLTIQTSEAYACWGLGATGKGVWTLSPQPCLRLATKGYVVREKIPHTYLLTQREERLRGGQENHLE